MGVLQATGSAPPESVNLASTAENTGEGASLYQTGLLLNHSFLNNKPNNCLYVIVLAGVSVAGKSFHDHGHADKGKHLTGAGLQFQTFSPLRSPWEARQPAGRHAAGE